MSCVAFVLCDGYSAEPPPAGKFGLIMLIPRISSQRGPPKQERPSYHFGERAVLQPLKQVACKQSSIMLGYFENMIRGD
jgi:hypothetical protein